MRQGILHLARCLQTAKTASDLSTTREVGLDLPFPQASTIHEARANLEYFMDKLSSIRQELDMDTDFLRTLLEGRHRYLRSFLDIYGDSVASIVTNDVILYTWSELQPFLTKKHRKANSSMLKTSWLHKEEMKRQQIIENMLDGFRRSPGREVHAFHKLRNSQRELERMDEHAAPPYEP